MIKIEEERKLQDVEERIELITQEEFKLGQKI